MNTLVEIHWSAEEFKRLHPIAIASWDYGRGNALPLWIEFICLSHWRDGSSVWHQQQHLLVFELPLAGDMSIQVDGSPEILRVGEMLILPTGVENLLKTGPSGFCRKLSFGICGSMAGNLLASYRIETGRPLPLTDFKRIDTLIHSALSILRDKDEDEAPRLTGIAMEVLTEIHRQTASPFRDLEFTQILRMMEFNLNTGIGLEEIARQQNISREKLHQMFRRHLKVSPGAYFQELRLRRAESLLREGNLSIQAVAGETGYASSAAFIREFRKKNGCTPGEFRRSR